MEIVFYSLTINRIHRTAHHHKREDVVFTNSHIKMLKNNGNIPRRPGKNYV